MFLGLYLEDYDIGSCHLYQLFNTMGLVYVGRLSAGCRQKKEVDHLAF